jgi:hypothetical protein
LNKADHFMPPLARDAAKELSQKIWPLGDQIYEIWDDLNQAGYGEVSATVREGYYAMAGSPEAQADLKEYWREEAKEGLASLVRWRHLRHEPSEICAYRSLLLALLRSRAHTLPIGVLIKSPQIEPTIKRYLEAVPNEFADRVHLKTRAIKASVAGMRGAGTWKADAATSNAGRYAALKERYLQKLEHKGFHLDPFPEQGIVFRKSTSNQAWQFIFEDCCGKSVRIGSIYPTMALVTPNAAVIPGHLYHTACAWIDLELLVPGFSYSTGFDRRSYGEFALAADTAAFLCNDVFDRLDALLSR